MTTSNDEQECHISNWSFIYSSPELTADQQEELPVQYNGLHGPDRVYQALFWQSNKVVDLSGAIVEVAGLFILLVWFLL